MTHIIRICVGISLLIPAMSHAHEKAATNAGTHVMPVRDIMRHVAPPKSGKKGLAQRFKTLQTARKIHGLQRQIERSKLPSEHKANIIKVISESVKHGDLPELNAYVETTPSSKTKVFSAYAAPSRSIFNDVPRARTTVVAETTKTNGDFTVTVTRQKEGRNTSDLHRTSDSFMHVAIPKWLKNHGVKSIFAKSFGYSTNVHERNIFGGETVTVTTGDGKVLTYESDLRPLFEWNTLDTIKNAITRVVFERKISADRAAQGHPHKEGYAVPTPDTTPLKQALERVFYR